jgi:hypothetical protein
LLITSIILCHGGDVKIKLDQAPAAVQKAIGEGKVEAVEKVTKDGTATCEVGCTLKSF